MANERLSQYGIKVKRKELRTMEIQSTDVKQVISTKAKQAKESVKKPFIIEDSGLSIQKLNGFPGALLKPVMDALGDKKLLKLIEGESNRRAEVKSILAYCERGKSPIFFTGTYRGKLSKKPRGKEPKGWAVSRIFIPEGSSKTLAEMNHAEWNKFLNASRKNDHYAQLGRWLQTSKKPKPG